MSGADGGTVRSLEEVARRRHVASAAVVALSIGLGAAACMLAFGRTDAPQERHITIRARQYAYDPPVIRVNRGDRLVLDLVALDVVHGFYFEGYDLDAEVSPQTRKFKVRHPSLKDDWQEQEELVIVADKPGKFRFRCSHTCGALHPFMNGELIVAPNRVLHAGIGACLGLLVGCVLVVGRKRRDA